MKSLRTVFVFALTATPALAESAGGLPQMDQTWFANQLLWLAISFGLLFVIVSTYIAPTAQGILKKREAAIDEAIAEAEKAKRAADITKSDFESGGQSARTTAAELIAKAQAENNAAAAEATAKLDHELARKLDQAEARISDARKQALADMQTGTANLAASMAAKLLGRPVSLEEATAATTPIVKLKKVG